MKRNLFSIMLLCATFAFALSSCSNDDENLAPTLNKTSLTLYVEETATLTYSGGKCTWSSDNSLIASVDNGVVTAKRVGETIIRANGAYCKVTVKPRYTRYEEPYMGWGQSKSVVKSHISGYGYEIDESTTMISYKVNSKTIYGYNFENGGLTMSVILTTSLSEASYLIDFCTERYIPVTIVDEDTYAFWTVDKKTMVFIHINTSYVGIAYSPYSSTKSNYGELADYLLEMKQKMDSFIQK